MAGAPLVWASVRQRCVAMSTAESEVVALGLGLKNALALRNLFSEIKEEIPKTIPLNVDNTAAIALAETSIHSKGLRHIDLCYAFINDEVEKGSVKVKYVSTKDQLADIFTKALDRVEHQRLVKLLLTDVQQ